MTEKGFAFPEYLAETKWLAEHFEDPDLRVVDMDIPEGYRRAHIPGAVTVPEHHYVKDPSNDVHVMPPTAFKELMDSLGIGDDTLVVAYDNSRGVYAARLWWTLRYYGHQRAKVLNGGWRKWFQEGRPATIDVPTLPGGISFTPHVDKSMIITTAELKEAYDTPDVVVWDVRSRGEFTGENPRTNRRPGHIPGAVHLEWLEAVNEDDHTLKPPKKLRAMLSQRGISPDKEIVTT